MRIATDKTPMLAVPKQLEKVPDLEPQTKVPPDLPGSTPDLEEAKRFLVSQVLWAKATSLPP
jgi:hypothetical protein